MELTKQSVLGRLKETTQTRKISFLAPTAVNVEARTVSFILISHENSVKRFDLFEGKSFLEVLDINGANVERLNSVFFNHETKELPIGRVDNVRVEDGQLKADVIFDEDEYSDKIFKKIVSGSLRGISIGYQVNNIDEQIRLVDGIEEVRVTDFDIFEASITGINADKGAVVGRSIEQQEIVKNSVEILDNQKDGEKMVDEITVSTDEVRKQELERMREITAIGEQFGKHDVARQFIAEGKSVDEFRSSVFSEFQAINAIDTTAGNIGMSDKEVRSYSLTNALTASLTGDWSKASFERELSQEVASQLNKESRGFYLPHDVMQKRELITTNAASAGNLVPTDYQGQNFIEILRNKMLTMNLGAKQLTGLTSSVSIPRQLGTSTVKWIEEGKDSDLSDMSFGLLALTPKTISAGTSYTRNMLLQGNPSIENLVLSDLAESIALGADSAVISGTGAAGEPLGILKTTGVNGIVGDGVNWKTIVDFETQIATANADVENMSYITTPALRGKMKSTPKETGHPTYLVSDDGSLNGYKLHATNQVPKGKIIFGDFSQIIIGMWSGLDIFVDPYKKSASGGVVIYAFQSMDVGIRHAESFSVNSTDYT